MIEKVNNIDYFNEFLFFINITFKTNLKKRDYL